MRTSTNPWRSPDEPLAPITRRQLRRALLARGITVEMVEGAITTLDEPDRSAALIDWRDATTCERHHPMIVQLAPAFGLTSADLDQIWASAPIQFP